MRVPVLTTTVLLALISLAWGANFEAVTPLTVESGDAFSAALPGIYRYNGQYFKVHIRGIEIPRLSASCERERVLAGLVLDVLHDLLTEADRVDLIDVERWRYTWVIASVRADGIDVAALLIRRGLARPQTGDPGRGWCGP